MREEKRMAGGYEIIQSIQIGDREIVVGENLNAAADERWMCGYCTENELIREYSTCIVSGDYLETMLDFADRLNGQIETVRAERQAVTMPLEPITAEQCYPHDYGQNLHGQVVAIRANVLRREYQRADRQLLLVTGGFGASANARGSAVFGQLLYSGEQTRFERHDILGMMKPECLPEWAKDRLTAIRLQQAETVCQTAGSPEVVHGYTITDKTVVGKKTFVIAHNPNAVQPYVTWQGHTEHPGYDWGHYKANRHEAYSDYLMRIENERGSSLQPQRKEKGSSRPER